MKFIRKIGGFLKAVIPALVGLTLLVLIIAWLAGVFTEKIQPGETAEIQRTFSPDAAGGIEEVHEVVKVYFSEAVGTLKAATRTEISARIMAPITEIRVKAGNVVRAGQPLVALDRRDAESRLNQAEASLQAVSASLVQAERDFQRDSDMYKEAAIAKKRVEQTKTALDVAQANVRRAEQAMAAAKVNLSYTVINAPQDGTIIDRLAEPGDVASPGVPLLVLYDPTSLRLETPVMENLAMKLKIGDVLQVHIDALNRDVEAVVDEIVPQAEAASRSFLVKVALRRSDELYEGMFGRLRISAGTRRHLCLATAAIQTIGQLQFVNVVKPDEKTIERRFIITGRLGMPGRVEVLSGLKAGEQVLIDPGTKQDTTPK
ncbi:MAG: efflux RND transporter periplasmic adaptor subunit [Planctomycetota bacterium]|nr:efflux RND transporter periplasmic adaptor subunit [Planctomycetota bacterium]